MNFQRVLIDMDEVLAKYTLKVIRTFRQETGNKIELDRIKGKFLSAFLEPKYVDLIRSYPYREGFFRDLEVMENSQEIVRQLQNRYEVFIVSSTTQHPNAPKSKLEWLNEHFPFIHYANIVFCGNKSIIRGDYLIDDHPMHLELFRGKPILFNAFHNIYEDRFTRVQSWPEIAKLLL